MPWTKSQMSLAHIAKQQLGWQDPQYRLILQNVAGIRRYSGQISSKNPSADNACFERFMAFCESQGFIDPKNGQGYWRNCVMKQQARMHFCIRELARRAIAARLISPDALSGFIERMTQQRPIEQGGPTALLEECDAICSFKILEGLKEWLYRDAKRNGLDARALLA